MDRGRGREAGRAGLTGRPGGRGDRASSARRIVLAGEAVDYRLVRARRRTIGMAVDLDGLTVRAPRWVTLREIEEALSERAAWILRTLAEWRSRRRDVLPREWRTGAPILYLGDELRLAVFPSRSMNVRADLFDLTVLHPSAQDERAVADTVARWLRDQAAQRILPRVERYARRVTDAVPPVRLSNARTVYICNIVTQPGQTDGFRASDHVRAVERYLGPGVLDHVIVNSKVPPPQILAAYQAEGSGLVVDDLDPAAMSLNVIRSDVLERIEERRILWEKQDLLRHDPAKLADLIMELR